MTHQIKSQRGWSRVDVILIATGLSAAIFNFLLRKHVVIDDADITFRYSWHLAHGYGLVFNPGQRVEGFTNMTWMLAMALAILAHINVAYFSVYLGLLFGLGSEIVIWFIMREFEIARAKRFLAILALSASSSFWLATTSGLETGFAAFLLSLIVLRAVKKKVTVFDGILGTLIFATRPELVVLPILVIVLSWIGEVRSNLKPWTKALPIHYIEGFGTSLILLEIFRVSYFGSLLPNTITAKSPPLTWTSLIDNSLAGLHYSIGYLWVAILPLGCLALSAVPLIRRSLVWSLIPVLLGWLCVTALVNGGDWMPDERIFQVVTPVLFVAVGAVLDGKLVSFKRFSFKGPQPSEKRSRLMIGTAVVIVLSLVAFTQSKFQRPSLSVSPNLVQYQSLLNSEAPGALNHLTIAPEAIGLICYDLIHTVCDDFLGLTDKTIADNGTIYEPTYGREDPRYTAEVLKPDLFITHSGLGHLRLLDYHGFIKNDYLIFFLPKVDLTLAIRKGVTPSTVIPRGWKIVSESLK